MKILVVSNLYPPQHVGGYELGCRDVLEQLRARGHIVQVLTSNFRNGKTVTPTDETEVERKLQFNMSLGAPPHDKRVECSWLAQALKKFQPDVVYFWNQTQLSYWLPFTAHWLGYRCAFFLSDANFTSWRIGAWLAKAAPKNFVVRALFGTTFLVRGWPIMENRTCHFASEFLKQVAAKHGITPAPRNSVVAHWGVDQSPFAGATRARWPVRRLLFAGQLIEQKGVHTAITALGLLAKEKQFSELTFSIVGSGYFPDYENQLRAQIAQLGLERRVNFLGKVPRPELPRLFAEHDALIFPSEWEEPFAITPLEAIASGLVVIGTTTGGSGELFRNRETAMTFAAGDAADCARAIRELSADRELFEKISNNAQRVVRENHTLKAMVDKIERSLLADE
jgi:glycosyltransferase involved in cell wall biosynthesis